MILNARHMAGGGGPDDRILLAIADITEQERARFELEGAKEFAEKLVDAVRDPLLVLDCDLRVKSANTPFYETFQVQPDETVGRLVYELGNGQWNIPRLRELLEDVLPDNNAFDDYLVEHGFRSEEHTSELQSLMRISYAVFCLKKKNTYRMIKTQQTH